MLYPRQTIIIHYVWVIDNGDLGSHQVAVKASEAPGFQPPLKLPWFEAKIPFLSIVAEVMLQPLKQKETPGRGPKGSQISVLQALMKLSQSAKDMVQSAQVPLSRRLENASVLHGKIMECNRILWIYPLLLILIVFYQVNHRTIGPSIPQLCEIARGYHHFPVIYHGQFLHRSMGTINTPTKTTDRMHGERAFKQQKYGLHPILSASGILNSGNRSLEKNGQLPFGNESQTLKVRCFNTVSVY